MIEKKIYELEINSQFESLIPPLSVEEFKQLEKNIKNGGCREPICVWKNTIIDGHNRYKICTKNNIPFYLQQIEFNSKEEAIDWICANQIGRRNISEETKRYLIGKRYEMEKILYAKNKKGSNQYIKKGSMEQGIDTAERLGNEYHIARGTVRKYAYYAKTVDKLSQKNSELLPDIFRGNIKISHENIIKLARKHKETVKNIKKQIDNKSDDFISYSEIKKMLPDRTANAINVKVKETPVYDPDADISSLAYTIPSWVSSIERTFSLVDFSKITLQARSKIQSELKKLKEAIDIMIEVTEEVNG